jgi:hypothetical protein
VKWLLIFAAGFIYVMLRAFQQRNVAFDNYWWVPPTSYGMAAVDMFVIVTVSKNGMSWAYVACYGTSAALGALFAMWFHKRWVKKK